MEIRIKIIGQNASVIEVLAKEHCENCNASCKETWKEVANIIDIEFHHGQSLVKEFQRLQAENIQLMDKSL